MSECCSRSARVGPPGPAGTARAGGIRGPGHGRVCVFPAGRTRPSPRPHAHKPPPPPARAHAHTRTWCRCSRRCSRAPTPPRPCGPPSASYPPGAPGLPAMARPPFPRAISREQAARAAPPRFPLSTRSCARARLCVRFLVCVCGRRSEGTLAKMCTHFAPLAAAHVILKVCRV